jgi:hypothetical protein
LLDSVRLELRRFKARSILLGACTSCPVLKSDLEAAVVEIKDLKHKLDHFSRYTVLSPPCGACVSLKGKLLHAIKENTELQQEVAYLTARLEKTALSEKMIEDDLSRVEESATKSTYRLGVGFERCDKKDEKSAPKFIPSSTYHKEEATIKSTKAYYPSNSKPSFNPKREVRKETPKPREEAFICMFCGSAGHDEDITPMDTNNTPQGDIQGPITRARARQLNLQVISFLRNYSCAFESSMLPNDLIVFRNEGEDQQGRGKDLGGVEDQRGHPDQDGSPNRFDFVSVLDSRNSSY